MTEIVEGPKIAALSCGKPAYVVVLLHGPDNNGDSIIGQALNWAPTMPKADFIAAEAPFSGAQGGRQWFNWAEEFSAGHLSPSALDEGLRTAAPLLDSFLDEVLARRHLPDSHLALVGFSQGAMLALHVGLGRKKQMAAIVSFSGALYNDVLEIRTKPPVLMIHGQADPVVTFDMMTATREHLKAQGVPVKSMRRPGLGHAIDDDGVIAAGDFLSAHVVHKPSADAAEHDHHHDEHEHH